MTSGGSRSEPGVIGNRGRDAFAASPRTLAKADRGRARLALGGAFDLSGETVVAVDQIAQMPLNPRRCRIAFERPRARRGGPVIFGGLLLLLPVDRTAGGCD